jgi:hypothetical protein
MAKLLHLDTVKIGGTRHDLPSGWGALFPAASETTEIAMAARGEFTRTLFPVIPGRLSHGETWAKIPTQHGARFEVTSGLFEIECTRNTLTVVKSGYELIINKGSKITLKAGDLFTLCADAPDAVYFVKNTDGKMELSSESMPKPVQALNGPLIFPIRPHSAKDLPRSERSSNAWARSKAG